MTMMMMMSPPQFYNAMILHFGQYVQLPQDDSHFPELFPVSDEISPFPDTSIETDSICNDSNFEILYYW